ncbi:MAG: cytochrome c maturation protein CcmE [Immundisolibacteraceae bacterium]|nr:cytochrome c maturation protein CcmE [Immundisolibacteraceae bacterium]
MKKRHRTLLTVIFGLAGLAAVAALVLNAFSSNLVYFRSPTDVAEGEVNQANSFRLGGMVREGSIQRQPDTLKVSFVVTDYNHDVKVHYDGVLPDLFREGQGVVTEGAMDQNGLFTAHTVLAKHDENYMPPEVADALEKAGKTASGEPLAPNMPAIKEALKSD